MKTSYFITFLFCTHLGSSTITAQSSDTSVATAVNVAFAPLEKNRVPFNILLDYGMELIDITKYDGVLRSDNYVNPVVYKDTYSILFLLALQPMYPELYLQ